MFACLTGQPDAEFVAKVPDTQRTAELEGCEKQHCGTQLILPKPCTTHFSPLIVDHLSTINLAPSEKFERPQNSLAKQMCVDVSGPITVESLAVNVVTSLALHDLQADNDAVVEPTSSWLDEPPLPSAPGTPEQPRLSTPVMMSTRSHDRFELTDVSIVASLIAAPSEQRIRLFRHGAVVPSENRSAHAAPRATHTRASPQGLVR
jgi:hypothetical protein